MDRVIRNILNFNYEGREKSEMAIDSDEDENKSKDKNVLNNKGKSKKNKSKKKKKKNKSNKNDGNKLKLEKEIEGTSSNVGQFEVEDEEEVRDLEKSVKEDVKEEKNEEEGFKVKEEEEKREEELKVTEDEESEVKKEEEVEEEKKERGKEKEGVKEKKDEEEEKAEEKDKASDLKIIEDKEEIRKVKEGEISPENFKAKENFSGKLKIGKGKNSKKFQANESQKTWILKEFLGTEGEDKLKNLYKTAIENPQNFKEKKLLDVIVYLNLLGKRFDFLKYLNKFPQVFEILFPKEEGENGENKNKLIKKLERTWEYKLNKDFKKKVGGIKEIEKIERDLYCILLDLIKRMNGIFEFKCKAKNVKKEELVKVSFM